MQFFGFRDLKSKVSTEVVPWEWVPDPKVASIVHGAVKAQRQALITRLGWLCYSAVRPAIATAFVEKDNPAAGLRGVVLDYDVPLVPEHLLKVLEKVEDDLLPQYVETTLSGHFRLVWVFNRDVPVVDSPYAEALLRAFAQRIKANELHPGLDPASFRPFQRWTAGRDWAEVGGPSAVPDAVLNEIIWEVGEKHARSIRTDIPLEKVFAEIETRWPGAWTGDFIVGVRGKRFWDATADNPEGCMVKPDGFVCFTGPKAVVSWVELLGAEWCRKAQEDRLADATAGIYFDGRMYWHLSNADLWKPRSREDTRLELMDRGFDDRVAKGTSISPCGRLLNLIQQSNRIDAAVSLVNYPPGLVTVRRQRLLNITRISALPPAAGPCTTADFPWLWEFLQGHFARPEARPLDHFLAWLQRAYGSLFERRRDMGQALFLCGPKHNGKTLLALRIIAPMLGDAYADPFDYLTGRTSFNSELFESFLWCLNDASSPREGEKGSVLSKIKDTVVNPSHNFHRKFGDRAQVDWQGRLLITLNDDPGSVALLPEVNSNTADKMCFFASQQYSKAWPANGVIETTLDKELPAFCRWLLDWTPPADVVENSRVGVKSYFDEHVLETSRRQGYAFNFRELLVQWVECTWAPEEESKELTPTELMSHLTSCDPVSVLARDWKVPVVSRALTTLARDPASGIVYNDGPRRSFTLKRSMLA